MDLRDWRCHAHPPAEDEVSWPSGVEGVDRINRGFRPGDLVFVLADSGVGKARCWYG